MWDLNDLKEENIDNKLVDLMFYEQLRPCVWFRFLGSFGAVPCIKMLCHYFFWRIFRFQLLTDKFSIVKVNRFEWVIQDFSRTYLESVALATLYAYLKWNQYCINSWLPVSKSWHVLMLIVKKRTPKNNLILFL